MNKRMDDRLQLFQSSGIIEDPRSQLGAVDLAGFGGPGKGSLDRGYRLPCIQAVHDGIGIVHRHAFLGKEARGGRLAHAQGAGQTDDEHGPAIPHARR